MAWTTLTFAFASLLTSTKMTQLQDNITAVAEGLSGAPNIETAGITDAAVVRAKLSTATTSLAGTVLNANSVLIVLNAYPFFPMIHVQDSLSVPISFRPHPTDGVSPDSPRFAVTNPGASSKTYDVDYRYVAA